jgi:endonuclease/exonuclease/phosphatase family metal-dependent hydrolase
LSASSIDPEQGFLKRSTQAALCAVFFLFWLTCRAAEGNPVVQHEGASAAFSADANTYRVGDADVDQRQEAESGREGSDAVRDTDSDATATDPDDGDVIEMHTDAVHGDTPYSGTLRILTYNVAGLPDFISGSNPEVNIPAIGALLNGYELVLVQEDFWYHDQLAAGAMHPYRSESSVASPVAWAMGDGLNRFSRFPFEDLVRVAWGACNGVLGAENDCLTTKGFSAAMTALRPATSLCVYNLHMDAGGDDGDVDARRQQAEQLANDLATRCAGLAVIVAGDTNLRVSRTADMSILNTFLNDSGLNDACRVLSCNDERVDRILFRSSPSLLLNPVSWEVPDEFVNAAGNDLSDHEPVAVQFRWEDIK